MVVPSRSTTRKSARHAHARFGGGPPPLDVFYPTIRVPPHLAEGLPSLNQLGVLDSLSKQSM